MGLFDMFNGPPKAPDYSRAATLESQRNAQLNRPNQTNAFGGFTNWQQGPGGQWSQTQGFGGPLGGAMDGLKQQAAQNFSSPMDWSQFGAVQDGQQARDQAITGAYNQATTRLDPRFRQQEQLTASTLANQGLDPNSEAYRNAMREQSFAKNDAYGGAMSSAIQQGTAAGDSVFRNSLMGRQQALAEALRKRGQPLEEMQGLQGLLQMPQANQVQGPNLLAAAGMQGQADMDRWGAEQKFWGDLLGGATDLGVTIATGGANKVIGGIAGLGKK